MDFNTDKPCNADDEKPVRKPYSKPLLDELGDLRTLTLGGSPFQIGDQSGPFDTGPFP